MPFINCQEGDLQNVFLTDSQLIERFVGDELYAWGLNTSGQLGNNTIVSQSNPVQTVSSGTNWVQLGFGVGNSGSNAGSIKTDGTLWLWGDGASGQLGNFSITNRSSPVQTVSTGTNWKQVSAGYTAAAAIKTDGTLWLWGSGSGGKLGTNSTILQSSPVQTVSTGTNWKQVSVGGIGAAIKTDGTLWLWGFTIDGKLGDFSSVNQSSPVQTVSTGTNWKQVASGVSHTAAIKTDGTLWNWGLGAALGTNSSRNHSSPVQTVSTGTNWRQVSTGSSFTGAVKIDGTLWLWGSFTCGALGIFGGNIDQSSPVQTVSTGTNWKQVSLGTSHTAAVKTDGTLWLWGNNCCGRLGNNDTINRSSPVQTSTTGTNWKQVSAAGCHTTAVTFTRF